jgi:hypothetical protein
MLKGREKNKEIIEYLLQAIEELEYGTIQITIHDSKVTQIDRLEKRRFPFQNNSYPKTKER